MNEDISQAIEVLEEIRGDSGTSKGIRDAISKAIDELKNNSETKAGIHKALAALDELADNPNIESYARSQIWNVVSLLETLSLSVSN